jgi:alpha-1,2-mannosyltransferase
LLDVGWTPFAAFLKHLPGLVSGEAFPALRNPAAVAINMSVPGIVFKLKLFGLTGASFSAARIVGWAYTVVAVWGTVVLARRPLAGGEKPLAWMAILILAALRSPFLPQSYGVFSSLWLLTLLASMHVANAKTVLVTIAGWFALSVFWPIDWPMDPRLVTALNAVPQVATIALAILVLRRNAAPAPSAVAASGALAT